MKVKLMLKTAEIPSKSEENSLRGTGVIEPEFKEVEFVTGLKFDRILGNNNSLIKVNTGIS